jgi:hypothetical protein
MRWDEVLVPAIAALEADSGITIEIGDADRIWPAEQTREPEFNSIEWFIVSDVETELYNRLLVSWDIRVRGDEVKSAQRRCADVERRLRRILTRPADGRIGGVFVNGRIEDSRTMPVPERDMYHRQVDVLFEPLRERYTAPNLA